MSEISDYSTTVIYKITCKDPNIIDKYVGHTIDFVRRRKEHKNNVCNKNSVCHDIKLYKFIRDNGGWDNWKMEVIAFYECNNLREALQKEQEHYIVLKASLNSVEPLKLKQTNTDAPLNLDGDSFCNNNFNNKPLVKTCKFICETCEYKCCSQSLWDKHIANAKHKKRNFSNNNFECKLCGITCNKQSDWNRHIVTNKHKHWLDGVKSTQKSAPLDCEICNKIFSSKYELKKHMSTKLHEKNISTKSKPDVEKMPETPDLTSMIMEMIKSNNVLQQHNQELQKQILEICKNGSSTTITNNN